MSPPLLPKLRSPLVHSYWPPFSVRDSFFQRPSLESLLNNIIREAAVSSAVPRHRRRRLPAPHSCPAIAQQLPSNCPRQPMAGGFEHNNDKRQRIQIHVLTYFFPMKADRSPFSAQEVRSVALLQKVHSIVLHCFAPHRSTSLAMPCEASIATVVRPAILAS